MPKKTTSKIADIRNQDKIKPSATARPIVIVDGPLLTNDPMVNPEPVSETVPSEKVAAVPVTREAKTIQPPLDSETITTDTESSGPMEAAMPETMADPSPSPESTASATSNETAPTEIPEEPTETLRDTEAAKNAAEAKQTAALQARQQELESLIESGKYAVPINAVQRKRSRVFVTAMSILAILLAIVAVDLLLDTGLVSSPGIPHTTLFSGN